MILGEWEGKLGKEKEYQHLGETNEQGKEE